MKNISIRVPWHEEGWSIYDEECPYCSSKEECIRESGRFMCGKLQSINVKHPYVGRPLFKKLDEQTGIQIAPFSFLARPFRWMLTENKNAEAIANYYPTMYDKTLEEQICKEIDYESIWVTHGKNQKTIFECFYKNSFYNNDLKHIAIDRTKVRSKSELIIANQLHFSGLD